MNYVASGSFASPSQLSSICMTKYILPHCLDTLYQRCAQLILPCPRFTQTTSGGTGISACCPSPTAFALGLGSTDPEQTNFTQGNLRFSAKRIFTSFIATHSDILTSHNSNAPFGTSSVSWERSSTTLYCYKIHNFGNILEPRVSSVQNHLTSELLRTL